MGDTLERIVGIEQQEKDFNRLIALLADAKAKVIDFNTAISGYKQGGATASATELVKANEAVVASTKQVTVAATEYNKILADTGNTMAQNIQKRLQLENVLKSNAGYQKALNEDLKTGKITLDEYNKTMVSAITTQEKNKQKLADVNKAIKDQNLTRAQAMALQKQEEKITADLSNDYKQLSLAYNEAALKAKNYTIQLGATHPLTVSAIADAKALDVQLKAADASVGQMQRNVGNYGSALSKVWGGLRTLANVLPGLGIAGVLAFAIDPIVDFTKWIFRATDAAKKYADQQQLIADLSKQTAENAGKETAALEIQRANIENVLLPMNRRLQAIKDLKDEYPEYFKGLTNEQLLAGNVGKAYDFAAAAILRKAKANAAASEIEKLSSANLDFELKNEQALQDMRKKSDQAKDQSITKRGTSDAAGTQYTNTAEAQKAGFQIAYNAQKKANDAEIALNKEKIDFLLKFAVEGGNETIKIEKEKVGKKTAITKAGLDYEYEIWKIQQNRLASNFKDMSMDEKKSLDDRVQMLGGYLNVQEALINRELEQKNKGANKEQQKLNQAKANDELIALEYKYYEDLAKIYNTAHKDEKEAFEVMQGDIRKATQKASDDLAKLDEKNKENEIEREKKRAQEIKDIRKRLEDELIKTAAAFIDGGFERQKNAIEDQKTLLDQQTKDEIDRINASTLSAQDKADKITAIQATALANKTALDAKEKEIERKKATFDRGVAIAEIIANVARAVSKDLLGNKGMIPFDIAIGAAQIAAILAHPIPKFKHGGTMAKDGMAMVGDGYKTEAMISPDGNVSLTPDKPTLTYIKAGTKIIGGDELDKVRMAINPIGQLVERKEKDNTLRDELRYQTTELIKVLKKQKGTNVRVYNDSKFNAFIQKSVRD